MFDRIATMFEVWVKLLAETDITVLASPTNVCVEHTDAITGQTDYIYWPLMDNYS